MARAVHVRHTSTISAHECRQLEKKKLRHLASVRLTCMPLTLLRSVYNGPTIPYLWDNFMWPNLSMPCKTSIYFTKKAIRCIFIRNKILKLDDLYTFELSKFMFDCIWSTSNCTYHTCQPDKSQMTEIFPNDNALTRLALTWNVRRACTAHSLTAVAHLDIIISVTHSVTVRSNLEEFS